MIKTRHDHLLLPLIAFILVLLSLQVPIVLASTGNQGAQQSGPTTVSFVKIATNPSNNWAEMATDGKFVYAATTSGYIQKINLTTGNVVKSSRLIGGAGIIALFSDGKYLYAGTTAPAVNYTVYKLSLGLKVLDRVNDPNGEGIARIVVPIKGGDVYFDDGGGYLYQYDPTLTTLLAEDGLFVGHSATDVIYDGVNLWWMDRFGVAGVTDLFLTPIAAGVMPGGPTQAKGLAVKSGVVYCGDGLTSFYRLGVSGSTVTFTKVIGLPVSSAVGKSPIFSNGKLYIGLLTTPGKLLTYGYPSLGLVRTRSAPDGNAWGEGCFMLLVVKGELLAITSAHLYGLPAGS